MVAKGRLVEPDDEHRQPMADGEIDFANDLLGSVRVGTKKKQCHARFAERLNDLTRVELAGRNVARGKPAAMPGGLELLESKPDDRFVLRRIAQKNVPARHRKSSANTSPRALYNMNVPRPSPNACRLTRCFFRR